MRRPFKTPARVALKEYLTPMRRPVGRPAVTWLKQIETDLNATNVQLNLSKDSPEQIIIITLEKITKDRSKWRRIIRDAMDGTHPNNAITAATLNELTNISKYSDSIFRRTLLGYYAEGMHANLKKI